MAFLNHYLHFNGNAEAVFSFYKSVFGGDFQILMRYKDVPQGVPGPEGEDGDKVMHISLPIGSQTILMGSDLPGKFGTGTRGDLSYVFITAESKEEAARLYQGLSEGGSIKMPIQDTFWGSYYGMFVDKYGVQWMVSYAYPQQG
jgi:PhnB protein